MSFRKHCEGLELQIRDEDMALIKWRLRMLPECLHRGVLEKYIAIYQDELAKEHPLNYARHGNARHYANRFIKLYR